jgi:hypothetical protein
VLKASGNRAKPSGDRAQPDGVLALPFAPEAEPDEFLSKPSGDQANPDAELWNPDAELCELANDRVPRNQVLLNLFGDPESSAADLRTRAGDRRQTLLLSADT